MPRSSFVGWLAIAAVLGIGLPLSAAETKPLPADRELPNIVKLEIFPAELTLSSERDIQGVIVTGHDEKGAAYDLTHTAKLSVTGNNAVLDAEGFLVPKHAGQTELVAGYEKLTARIPVNVKLFAAAPVNFVREILPVMSKVGCNAGTCHGRKRAKTVLSSR